MTELRLAPWSVVETSWEPDRLGLRESIFTVGNGFLGIRGSLDEGDPGLPATFLAGVYEHHPLSYPEAGYGDPERGEAMIGVADGTPLRVQVDGVPLDFGAAPPRSHRRELDLRAGLLRREAEFEAPAGAVLKLTSERIASLSEPAVAGVRHTIEALRGTARLVVRSALRVNGTSSEVDNDDPRVAEALDHPFEPVEQHAWDSGAVLTHRTRRSGITVAACVDHAVDGDAVRTLEADEDEAVLAVSTDLAEGDRLTVTKFLGYAWSAESSGHGLTDRARGAVAAARKTGWAGLLEEQRRFLDDFWTDADVEVEGDDDLQAALRFDLFQILQSSAHTVGAPVGAKGLTGSGYSGHTFWDIEGFVLPVLTFLRPQSARQLLSWRASTLPHAQERAEVLGLEGASFAWRTIEGHEVSAYWPASVAAMHLNADIARAFHLHAHVSGDDLPDRGGVEVLIETARLWMSMGQDDHEGRWHLFGMTGPDEYTGVVDDNVYTNLMAARNLRAAADVCDGHPDLAAARGVASGEIASWRDASERVYIPFDENLGVHPACENFTSYGEWNFAERRDQYPVQKYAHYGKMYRRQVIKQADLVQALWWCEDSFTPEQIAADLDYYERRTVRDSSLSAAVQAVVCARAGHLDLALAYLREAALVDLRDLQSNAVKGLHLASLAGAWLALTAGLGGLREDREVLSLSPRLPASLDRVAFRLAWRGSHLRVETTRAGTRLSLRAGDGPVELDVDGRRVTVDGDVTEVFELLAPEPLLPTPTQPVGREPRA